MRFLITGIDGFAGLHLARELRAQGHEVFGVTRGECAAGAADGSERLCGDVADTAWLTDVVRQLRPAGIFHLAAISSVPASYTDPEGTYRTNFGGSVSVFRAVRDAKIACRIAWVGSCDAYGVVEEREFPIKETQPFCPVSPYGVSKAAGDCAAFLWSQVDGLDIVRLRPFSHTGPRQALNFLCPNFARQAVEVAERRRSPRIEVGNLDVVRDFSDVRDVVRAYVIAWKHGQSGEAYNVCSGVGQTPGQILRQMLEMSGAKASIVQRAERKRSADIPVVIGSPRKLQDATGWKPAIPWKQTLEDLLREQRELLRCGERG